MEDADSIDVVDLLARNPLTGDYPQSLHSVDGAALWLQSVGGRKRLAVLARPDGFPMARFTGARESTLWERVLWLCPADAANAAALRDIVPGLRPVPLGLTTSAGFGDRLGLATPGHVHALREAVAGASDRSVDPIFAQQSIREMTRTHRTPVDVMTDATWGAFEAGWRGRLGADADHLKTTEDVDITAAAGYTFFTIDPSAYVDDSAHAMPGASLRHTLETLPWEELESDPEDLRRRYADTRVELEDRAISIGGEALARAAVKYGHAIAHVRRLYRHLVDRHVPFELEVSIDETETPTSPVEHVYITGELHRLGVEFVSLAPRYVGRFEKGVDFIGDLDALAVDLEVHAQIARALGPYKLSLHSGSDKFLVYPLAVQATRGLVHLKTAGTSYLEALRVVAAADPALFREVLALARDHYVRDRATYHVSAVLEKVPASSTIPDDRLPALLDEFDARQVLHVTFGTVLDELGAPLREVLRAHERAYDETLARHFVRHLAPFVQSSGTQLVAGRGR